MSGSSTPSGNNTVVVTNTSTTVTVLGMNGSENQTVVSAQPDYTIQAFQTNLYFSDLTASLLESAISTNTFVLQENGVLEYDIPAEASKILLVLINGLDYSEFCAITPALSGKVIYTVPPGGYVPQSGDRVAVYWVL